MIRLPREVKNILTKLNNKGFDAFVVGGSLRDSLMGLKPVDWDLATNARLENILEIFPNAKILSEKLNVAGMDFTKSANDEQSPIVDIATFRRELETDEKGRPTKFEFADDITEDLKRRDFTVNAMAYSANRGIVDPFGGREDIKKKIVRCVGDADTRIKEDPIRILRGITLVAEKGFSLQKDLYNAICKNYRLIENIGIDRIRDEFIRIMGGKTTGDAIRLMKDTGIIKVIAGERADDFFFRKKALYLRLIRKIDETYPISERRLGLFFNLLDKDVATVAIDRMQFDKKTKMHMLDVVNEMTPIGGITKPVELKEFISRIGVERYHFLDEVAQDKVVVYGGSPRRINKRMKMINLIEEKNEPVFLEDLMITGDDIKSEIGVEGKIVGEILNCILLDVHRKPFKNHRGSLIEMARSYGKSKIKRKIRQNKWLNRLR